MTGQTWHWEEQPQNSSWRWPVNLYFDLLLQMGGLHWKLDRLNRHFGPYDVIHNHRHLSSCVLLRAAHKIGVTKRIAHSYADTEAVQSSAGMLRRLGYKGAQGMMRRHMTHGIGTSSQAASSMFGQNWPTVSNIRLQPLGCDFSSLNGRPMRDDVRVALGLDTNTWLLISLSSFERYENPMALVDIATAISARAPQFRMLVVGEGPLCSSVLEYINRSGLRDTVLWEPAVNEPAHLIQAADGYVSTSLVEDFGLPILRAQACGIPCFLSTPCPPETTVLNGLLHRLPLEAGANEHAETILRHKTAAGNHMDSYVRCVESKNSIENYAETLRRLYLSD